MNPLDTGGIFSLELMNPNPTSSKTKDGPKYRVSFEVNRTDWDCFMDANTNGMVIEMQGRVTQRHADIKGGALSHEAAQLCLQPAANKYAASQGYDDFQHMIYSYCAVDSRAELDHDESAGYSFNTLKSNFYTWKEAEHAAQGQSEQA